MLKIQCFFVVQLQKRVKKECIMVTPSPKICVGEDW